MNALTLAARYRNAKAERVLFAKMPPAIRCMALIEEYRDLTAISRDGDEWAKQQAESSMEQLDREFASARAQLRAEARFNRALEAA